MPPPATTLKFHQEERIHIQSFPLSEEGGQLGLFTYFEGMVGRKQHRKPAASLVVQWWEWAKKRIKN